MAQTDASEFIKFSVPDITEGDVAAVTRALTSGWITTGAECKALEEELAAYVGVDHVVAMASCTAALEIAVVYLGLPRGARVGIPTWTFVSTALAAYHRGCVPVPLDVDEDTFNLSESALLAALDDGLDAVIGVHFAGTPLSPRIHELCAARGVPFIEDAAHAFGATDHRGAIGGVGTAGCCYSFYATKNLTSVEGGALATDDPDLAAFAQSFRLHGMSRDAWARYLPGAATADYDLTGDGLKANMPDVLAALARSQLVRFDDMQAIRRRLSHEYRARIGKIDGVRLVPAELPDGGADHLMMILLPEGLDRSRVQTAFSEQGIGTSVHFQPLHTFDWFARNGVTPGPGGTPVADRYRYRALSLPLHTALTDTDVERICGVLEGVVAAG